MIVRGQGVPCLVGITTDVEQCRTYWTSRVVGLCDWQVLSSHCTRWTARDAAEDQASESGCELDLETSGAAIARWSVFRFRYER